MLFISVFLFNRPCKAMSFLNPETVAYSLSRQCPECHRNVVGDAGSAPCCARAVLATASLGAVVGSSSLPFLLFWWGVGCLF